MSGPTPVRDAPRRVSYVLPPLGTIDSFPQHRFWVNADGSTRILPVFGLPPRVERQSCLKGAMPTFRRLDVPPPQVTPDAYEHAMRPRHLLPVTSLEIDTTTPICESDSEATHSGILYTAGKDGLVCAWDLGLGEYVGYAPRQSIRIHAHWISDIKLCNQNQTLLTASSDCAIKAWNPHDPNTCMSPQLLGFHKDYVKALALAPATDCVVSASLDHTVRLWDLQEGRHDAMWHVDAKSSLYSVGASRTGTVIAAAGVDHLISGWDPRMRRKSFELVGHLDNVRALSVSHDGRHLLSGSADSTVRLWSVGEQRCIRTFEHHNSSVWSLCAPSGDFSTFYSGDRDGYLCKVEHGDIEGDSYKTTCVSLAREYYDDAPGGPRARGAAIHSIAAIPGSFVWTANASHSVVSCWADVPPECAYTDTLPQNRVSLAADPDANMPFTASDATPLHRNPLLTISGFHGIVRAAILSDRVHALTIDTGGIVAVWNVVRCICLGTLDFDQVTQNGIASGLRAREEGAQWQPQDTPGDTLEVIQELVDGQGATAPWCTLDASNGMLTVHISENQALAAEVYLDDVFADPTSDAPRAWSELKGNVGVWVLRNLASGFIAREKLLRTKHALEGIPLLLQEPINESLEERVFNRIYNAEADLPTLSPFCGNQAPPTPVRLEKPSPLSPGISTTQALARDATALLHAFRPQGDAPVAASAPKKQFFFPFSQRRDRDRAESTPQGEVPSLFQQHADALREILRGNIPPQPPTDDVPDLSIAYPPAVIVSRISQGSEMLQITYGGKSTKIGAHADIFELVAPLWLLRILLVTHNQPEPCDVRLTVSPWRHARPDDARLVLPELQPREKVLMTSRILRVGRIAVYIGECLANRGLLLPVVGASPGTRTAALNTPIELLCNGMHLMPHCTLAQVQRHCWKNAGDIRIEYRLRADVQ